MLFVKSVIENVFVKKVVFVIYVSETRGRRKFRHQKFRRVSKCKNFVVRNLDVRNFVALIRINSVYE